MSAAHHRLANAFKGFQTFVETSSRPPQDLTISKAPCELYKESGKPQGLWWPG